MSCIWLSANECSKLQLLQLKELIGSEKDLQIIFSDKLPATNMEMEMMEGTISDLLIRLGVRPNLKGYLFLRTAIKLCIKDREELDGITKRLYPSVARKYGSTADKVEHAIRHAIEVSWIRGDGLKQEEVFGFDARTGRRPTNAEFIARVTDYIEKMSQPLYS